ncbi:hypothetical protein BT63DRAFT_417015 [Microthyrium microscopicum]|uniref:EGF-like domain-containing protein n=1 Tax=Microthyrium microscopicum TaxID=703497 RepID=A0A6A6U1D2_9PEZI|nr:hypothetical protein BT63DRAFT_417015 [Microthyrium microscopicum]
MMLLKLAVALPALFALTSAMTLERNAPGEMSIAIEHDASARNMRPLSFSPRSACDKEDESDCKEFCEATEQTATCTAAGNKITCSCRGGKKGESNCEERCLLCMPDQSALKEAGRVFELGGWSRNEL